MIAFALMMEKIAEPELREESVSTRWGYPITDETETFLTQLMQD